jgi:hypothetical protein
MQLDGARCGGVGPGGSGAGPHPETGGRACGERIGEGAREKKSLTGGDRWSEGERRKGRRALAGEGSGADTRARAAARGREGRKRLGAGLVAGPAHAGREKKRGPGREREEEGRDGPSPKGLGLLSSFLLFLFPFYTQIIQKKLFEFKFYELNTRKIMFQHECTNMLIL